MHPLFFDIFEPFLLFWSFDYQPAQINKPALIAPQFQQRVQGSETEQTK